MLFPEWVLILTIVTTHSAAIHSIPMYNISACNEAGEAWAAMFSDKKYHSWVCKRVR